MADQPPKGKKPTPRLIDDQDAALLEKVFRDVDPLPGRKVDLTGSAALPPPLPNQKKSPPRPRGAPPTPNAARLAPLAHGAAPGLDKRTAQRMRRGQMLIEGRLDLHGMTQDGAYRALGAFLAEAHGAGKRCVMVVTGKGLRPDGSIGVLRAAVPRWLNEPGLRERILSFSHARPRDGGTGALYVLLKRAK